MLVCQCMHAHGKERKDFFENKRVPSNCVHMHGLGSKREKMSFIGV